jgi:hypothetical protein
MILLLRNIVKNSKFKYPVTIQWGRGADTMDYWDNLSIYSIEHFGLPGDRYVTDITADHMTWTFRSEHDALIIRLRFSEVTS